jgi:hypothetical protein
MYVYRIFSDCMYGQKQKLYPGYLGKCKFYAVQSVGILF